MTPVQQIQSYKGNQNKWLKQGRGFVDWRFGQVAEYMGYERAVEYVKSMRSWYNFEDMYSDCLLNTSYQAFTEALKNEE